MVAAQKGARTGTPRCLVPLRRASNSRLPFQIRVREPERDLTALLLLMPVRTHRAEQSTLRLHELVDDSQITAPVVRVVQNEDGFDRCRVEVDVVLQESASTSTRPPEKAGATRSTYADHVFGRGIRPVPDRSAPMHNVLRNDCLLQAVSVLSAACCHGILAPRILLQNRSQAILTKRRLS